MTPAEIQYRQVTEHLYRSCVELESTLDWLNKGNGTKEITKIYEKLQQIYFNLIEQETLK